MALLLWLLLLLIARAGEVSAIQSGSDTAAVMTTVCVTCVACLRMCELLSTLTRFLMWQVYKNNIR